MKKILDKANYLLTYIMILLLPIIYIIRFVFGIFDMSMIYFHEILWLLIPILMFIYCYNLKNKKFKISIYDVIFYILIILIMISVNMSIDMTTSIWGAYHRNEGFLSIFSYYLLFLNCKDIITKDQIKKIIKVFIIVGLIQYLICILQVFVRGPFGVEVLGSINYMAMGFHGNPNFLGSHVVLLLSLTITLYLLEKKSKIYLFLSIVFFSNLILAASTGPFFSIIFTIIFLIILLAIKKKINFKKVVILIISLILTYIITDFTSQLIFTHLYNDNLQTNYTIKGDLKSTLNIFTNKENNDETLKNYGSGRLVIWQNSLKLIPKYLFFGCGPDNFGYAYSKLSYNAVYCDKAHNEYLQTLITQGIFVFITYLTLLGIIFFKGLKCKDNLTIVLLISFVGYSVQAFLNISVTTVAPFYFIIMGLLVNQIEHEKTIKLQ